MKLLISQQLRSWVGSSVFCLIALLCLLPTPSRSDDVPAEHTSLLSKNFDISFRKKVKTPGKAFAYNVQLSFWVFLITVTHNLLFFFFLFFSFSISLSLSILLFLYLFLFLSFFFLVLIFFFFFIFSFLVFFFFYFSCFLFLYFFYFYFFSS